LAVSADDFTKTSITQFKEKLWDSLVVTPLTGQMDYRQKEKKLL
jgi:hypothetical protein